MSASPEVLKPRRTQLGVAHRVLDRLVPKPVLDWTAYRGPRLFAGAETYYRLAREAKTEADRLALLDLAKSWLEAASREDAKSVRERRRSWRARAATTGRVFDRLRPR
jgi:hypothetical protein